MDIPIPAFGGFFGREGIALQNMLPDNGYNEV